MFDLTIKNILANTWPMILIITIILSSLRIAYLLKYHEKFKFYEEITQLIIGRVFDVDDIMLNVCGGILGYFVYRFIHHFKNKLPNIMKNDIFYNIVTTILIGIIIVYIIGVLEVI